MQWVWKAVFAVGCLLGLLAFAGASYQIIATRRDARRTPEPGRLVDVGGYRLRIHCMGAGSPTIVLESGLGDVLPEWQRVQSEIARFTRVCSYDRAGYGGSDAGPMPRTSTLIAGELHTLLQHAGEKSPFVLIGHSFGGYNVRVFAGEYPDEVAGMVLLDATQEDQYRLLPPAWHKVGGALLQHYQKQARLAPLFVGLGIARLMLHWEGGAGPYDYLILQSKYLQARASELANIQISAEQARAAGGLGDKPLVVLTAGKNLDPFLLHGMNRQDLSDYRRIWVEILQPRLARLSTRGKQVVLQNSGHDVPADDPDAVVNAVHEVWAAAASRQAGR